MTIKVKWTRISVKSLVFLIGILIGNICAAQNMRAHFIDVGQGASTILEFPCAAVLIDAGGESNAQFKSNDELVAYLDAFFERRKDLKKTFHSFILTHPHKDHTNGVKVVLENYRVLNAVTNGQEIGSGRYGQKALHDKVAAGEESENDPSDDIGYLAAWAKDIPKNLGLTSSVIDPVKCRDVDPKITLLWGSIQQQGKLTAEQYRNQNNHSVVVRIDFGKASMLVTGDLEDTTIPFLIDHYKESSLLDVDLYQVGHHGSYNGTTEGLLKVVRPDYVVMATSPPDRKQNWTGWAYGHPRKQTVDLLVRYVKKTREAVNVPVATAVKKFSDFRLTKAIYANGWDGNIVMEANISGFWKVMDNDALQHEDDPSALLNINTASIEELEALPMIGSARANAIIKSRQDLGPFKSVDDLLRIPRFGKGTVSVLKNLVRTGD